MDNSKDFLELYNKADADIKRIVDYILTLNTAEFDNMLKATGIDKNNIYTRGEAGQKLYSYIGQQAIKEQLSLKDVQTILDVSYKTALGYIQSGLLPAHRVGGKWKINRKDFEAFAYGK